MKIKYGTINCTYESSASLIGTVDVTGYSDFTAGLSTTAKLNDKNVLTGQQLIVNSVMGSNADSAAIQISARVDQNQYSRPSVYLDCFGYGGCLIFFDTDGKLKAAINGTYYTIAG